ncbi:hypothetical protein TWF506_003293 [Arthrobotrys conoides]|uniref:Uncharacterized protein n=1 Tax=Arthrobotrys conoides TaxID=74498 RepID=A0AAN8NHX5_9PEZI
MSTSSFPAYNYLKLLTFFFSLFLLFQLSICPDPDEILSSTDLKPAQQQQPDVELPNQAQNFIAMTEQQYENWIFENAEILSHIALQMEWLEELRAQCPLGPSPPKSGEPGPEFVSPRSLSFLVRTINGAISSFQEDVVTMSKPIDDLYDVGKLIREMLGWSRNEAPAQARRVSDIMKRAVSQMKAFWEQYYFLEKESREDWVNLPASVDDVSARVIFVATRIVPPMPVGGEDGGGDRTGVLNVDVDSIVKKIGEFNAQLKWIRYAVRVGNDWAQAAEDNELDNPVYTQMLDRPRYDPDHKRGIRNQEFNLLNILQKAAEWYNCWMQPIQSMVMLMEQLTPLPTVLEASPYQQEVIDDPGVEEEEVLLMDDVKEEPWSTRPLQQDFVEDTILKQEDDVVGEEIKVEGSPDQWSARPVNQDYVDDIIFKEEEGVEERLVKEGRVRNPNVMSLEDIPDI